MVRKDSDKNKTAKHRKTRADIIIKRGHSREEALFSIPHASFTCILCTFNKTLFNLKASSMH